MLITGYVEKVLNRPGQWGDMWSVVIDNTFYGFKKIKPSCNQGDYVQLSAEQNPKGYWDADPKSLAPAAPPQATRQAVGAGVPSTRGLPGAIGGVSFNDRQDAISYQAARNSALSLVGMYITAGAIPFPAKAKDSDKKAIVDLYVAKETARFFEDTKNLKPSVLGESKSSEPVTLGTDPDFVDDEKLPF